MSCSYIIIMMTDMILTTHHFDEHFLGGSSCGGGGGGTVQLLRCTGPPPPSLQAWIGPLSTNWNDSINHDYNYVLLWYLCYKGKLTQDRVESYQFPICIQTSTLDTFLHRTFSSLPRVECWIRFRFWNDTHSCATTPRGTKAAESRA